MASQHGTSHTQPGDQSRDCRRKAVWQGHVAQHDRRCGLDR